MTLIGAEDAGLTAWIQERHPLPGVRAGSALLRIGNGLLAVQDDAWSVAWISLPDLSVRMQPLKGDGAALPKSHKPDFEAALRTRDGTLHLLGSGSTARRCAVARIAADFSRIEVSERPELYADVQRALGLAGRVNVEAATLVTEDRLRLFHRGAGAQPSASVDLRRAVLDGRPADIVASQRYALGHIDNAALHVTDAACIDRSRTAFLAAAERTDDALADGPVTGSVLGLIEEGAPRPPVRWTRLLEPDGRPSRRKAEGLVVDGDRRGAWLLTDPDSLAHPAELCRVRLEGFE
ncbi:MAG: hypothetical protein IT480_02290 [Gammaproteobacteria bacterium]|nr:hypothetical protein [Gammaproteobacteria bacterium]